MRKALTTICALYLDGRTNPSMIALTMVVTALVFCIYKAVEALVS